MVMFTEHQLPRTSARVRRRRSRQQLEADVKAGALGLGEIMKDFGMTCTKADGTRLQARRSRARSDLGDRARG